MTKYEILTSETCSPDSDQTVTLFQIRALKDFAANWRTVKAGELGGYIGGYVNLSQEGGAWVFPQSCVWENAVVEEDACVTGWAEIAGRVVVKGKAYVDSGYYADGRTIDDRTFPPPTTNFNPAP
ncbi:MAG: hypothetical protein ACK5NN_12130 [Sphingomonadaceae bacterium]